MKLILMIQFAHLVSPASKTSMIPYLNEKLERQLKAQLLKLKKGLSQESAQTQEMLHIYYRYSSGENVSKEDFKKANQQFRSFMKTLGIGVLVILPFAPLTLPAVVMLGKKIGIDVIPKSFQETSEKESD